MDLGTHKTASGADFYTINPKGAHPAEQRRSQTEAKPRSTCGSRRLARPAARKRFSVRMHLCLLCSCGHSYALAQRSRDPGTAESTADDAPSAAGNVPALVLDSGVVLNEGAAALQAIADKAPGKVAPENGTDGRYLVQAALNYVASEARPSAAVALAATLHPRARGTPAPRSLSSLFRLGSVWRPAVSKPSGTQCYQFPHLHLLAALAGSRLVRAAVQPCHHP